MLVQVNKFQKIKKKMHDWRVIGGNLIPIQGIFSIIKHSKNSEVKFKCGPEVVQ